MSKPHAHECTRCGSDDVVKEGNAYWNRATQQWEVADPFSDSNFCNVCDIETRLKKRDLTPEEVAEAETVLNDPHTPHHLSVRALSTILAALRLWQRTTYDSWRAHDPIATNEGEVTALDDEEIDALCQAC